MKASILAWLILPLACGAGAVDIDYISSEALPALGPYSPATAISNLVFTSGQIAFDAELGKVVGDDIESQTRKAMDNLRAVLEASGSSLQDTLRITVYLKNPEDFPAMNKVYAQYFPGKKPARTTVPGVEWGPGILIEVDAIAVRSPK
ncbi:MAG: RidA family protein [Proteobacteria bacterium]|nr:RidA family protein [Pseudomonadota bacterium]